MIWEKEIRFRLTLRRMVGIILAATSAVNLVIVGLVFTTSAPLPTPAIRLTATRLPTALPSYPFVALQTPLPAVPVTQAPGPEATYTPLPTDAPSLITGLTSCAPGSLWLAYTIQPGDTLSSIAVATGATVEELMRENCLTSNRIDAGRELHVPRLPIKPAIPAKGYPLDITTPPAYPG